MRRFTTAILVGLIFAISAAGGILIVDAYNQGVDDGRASATPSGRAVRAAQSRQQMLRAGTELHPGQEAQVLPGQKLLDGWTVATKPALVTDCCGTFKGNIAVVAGEIRNDNPGPVSSDHFSVELWLSGDNTRGGWVICDTPSQRAGKTSAITCKGISNANPNYDRIELGDPNE